jgi:glycosyltransferase involved in cell wall biosynthesis
VNTPLVSIIVRTKDRPKLLRNALGSIAGQTYRQIEVILVNDGGCDFDVEELKSILGGISLNYIRLERNTGRAHAGNVGIENAKGEYIGFLDDDDVFYPEHVETLITFLEQSDYKIAYSDSLMVYKEYNPQTQEMADVKKEMIYSQDFDYDTLLFENFIPFMCLLFDREVLSMSGGLDKNLELYEDWDLLIRVGEKFPFYHIRKTTADYVQWSSAIQISQKNKDINFLRESYLRLFDKHITKFTPESIYSFKSRVYDIIKGKETHIRDIETFVKDKDTYIKNLQDVIKGKDQYINSIIYQLEQRDQHISNLESLVKEKDFVLHSIYSSRGWKVLLLYYRIRDKILPPNSIRRRTAKRVFKPLLLFLQYLLKCLVKKKESVDG